MLGFLGRVGLHFYSTTSLWTPALLFAAGEPGVWYDPSDLTTMFTDAAGTTPVTAVEQPVGLLLDKSKGGRQSLAVTGWAKNSGDGTVTVVDNTITITGATTTTRVDIAAPGWAVGDYADMTVTGSVAGATGQILYLGGGTLYSTLSGTNTFRNVIVSSTLLRLQISTGSATFVVTSRGYVPGNHASQSTAASRPVLSARVNLLTYSEQFNNAYWTLDNSTVDANATTAPDGTTTADRLNENTANTEHKAWRASTLSASGISLTASCHMKADTATYGWVGLYDSSWKFAIFNLSTGAVVSSSVGITAVTAASGSFYRCSITYTPTSAVYFAVGVSDGTSIAYTGTSKSIYLWGADLRVTNVGVNLPAYQRVAAATDYDTTGFPLYLKFDGVDDSLATGSINLTGTSKLTAWAGVRKLSDASLGAVFQFANSGLGSFGHYAPEFVVPRDGMTWEAQGTGSNVVVDLAPYAAPVSYVLTGETDLAAPLSRARINGGSYASSTSALGGSFSTGTITLGELSASFRFNGNLYSLIVRGALSTDAQIASTETYVNNLTKAY